MLAKLAMCELDLDLDKMKMNQVTCAVYALRSTRNCPTYAMSCWGKLWLKSIPFLNYQQGKERVTVLLYIHHPNEFFQGMIKHPQLLL